MRAMTRHLVMVGLTAAMVCSTARAAARETFSAGRSRADEMRIGIALLPMPIGVLRGSGAGSETGAGSVFALGVMTSVDFVTRPNAFVGFAASYAFGIKAHDTDVDPSQELDLLLRIGYTAPVGGRVHAYGYLAPGYSFVYRVPGGGGAQGLVIGLHGGGRFDVTPRLFLDAELGYQAGFQRDLHSLIERNERTTLVQAAIGVGVRMY
jgi:hypothetical protein